VHVDDAVPSDEAKLIVVPNDLEDWLAEAREHPAGGGWRLPEAHTAFDAHADQAAPVFGDIDADDRVGVSIDGRHCVLDRVPSDQSTDVRANRDRVLTVSRGRRHLDFGIELEPGVR
jgi:hypothetical protein